jgi:hypothetical protein
MSGTSRRIAEPAAVVAAYIVLTSAMMWPMVRHLADVAVPHQDVYFNMWRLHWVAHALAVSPRNLFNANVFYPEPRTLLFSDAMLVEGVTAAPFVWFGVRPVLVHNLMLLGAIVGSAAATFALVRHLTGSRGGALLAGTIFAFAPYRFEHMMHMELQWTVWIPLAFLAMQRTFEHGRMRDGLATGVAVVLQMFSSIYYGLFLVALLTVGGALLQMGRPWREMRRAILPLVAGALVAAALVGLYARPYLRARDRVGERPTGEVRMFAARPSDYLVSAQGNWFYGQWQKRGESERRLFPGGVAVLLTAVALLLRRPTALIIVCALSAVAAFEASLGLRGYSYSFLHEHVNAFHALRAPARLGIFVVFFVAVLAGFGYTFLAAALRARYRALLVGVLMTLVLAEYFTRVELVTYANTPPPVYRLLATQPPGVVAEFPMPLPNQLPGRDPQYEYFSIFHWKPLVNGYSGFYPPTYLRRLLDVRRFPEPFSLRALRRDGVRYLLVHESGYGEHHDRYAEVLAALEEAEGIRSLGVFNDGEGMAAMYELR